MFFVLGTPRSRTAWLAKFLSFGGRQVLHEPSVNFKSLDDLKNLRADGVVDSMLTFRWRDIVNEFPMARIVVVHRNLDDVYNSFENAGGFDEVTGPITRNLLLKLHIAMRQLLYEVPVLSVPFKTMDDFQTINTLFEYCLQKPLPLNWYAKFEKQNIQADFQDTLRRTQANLEGLRTVYPEAFA